MKTCVVFLFLLSLWKHTNRRSRLIRIHLLSLRTADGASHLNLIQRAWNLQSPPAAVRANKPRRQRALLRQHLRFIQTENDTITESHKAPLTAVTLFFSDNALFLFYQVNLRDFHISSETGLDRLHRDPEQLSSFSSSGRYQAVMVKEKSQWAAHQ